MSSSFKIDWIQHKLPLLNKIDVNQLCGFTLQNKDFDNNKTKILGNKRKPEEDSFTLQKNVETKIDDEDKKAKLEELK